MTRSHDRCTSGEERVHTKCLTDFVLDSQLIFPVQHGLNGTFHCLWNLVDILGLDAGLITNTP